MLALCVLTSLPTFAQPSSGGPTPANPLEPAAVPIDGGVSLLLAGGVAYGIKQLKARRVAGRSSK
ncbi:hypothetical protein I2I05_14800 [Hymenobacter sp. BT683]|uniref:VPDSG-CTERM sorting domain-containing protein n=1 Tax=Hymenobacter jeongseonensis TaxID=2791027 RepID=A0ABS0IJZ9_9BACT|nr:hypothetical protein [Hymenobacter jeongseonensis]